MHAIKRPSRLARGTNLEDNCLRSVIFVMYPDSPSVILTATFMYPKIQRPPKIPRIDYRAYYLLMTVNLVFNPFQLQLSGS